MPQRARGTDLVKHFDETYISASAGDPPPSGDTNEDFRKDLLGLIPFLRAFSRSLCGDRELADDLAQEALAKAKHDAVDRAEDGRPKACLERRVRR